MAASRLRSPLSDSTALDAYCAALQEWLRSAHADDSALRRASEALCIEGHALGALPEHLLILLHARGLPPRHLDLEGPEPAHRYVRAVRLLLRTYFGTRAD